MSLDSKEIAAMAPNGSLQYEVKESGHEEQANKVTTISCRGRLVNENAGEMKELVRPFIALGGRIVIDLSDLNYLDSAGLGELLALKVSAIKQGVCKMQFVNMTPRILELFRVTHLEQILLS
jgi:anti-anti-sigma factor